MKLEQRCWTQADGWAPAGEPAVRSAQLVLAFGAPAALERAEARAQLRRWYPEATFVGCSTAGEIYRARVIDDSIVATAVRFEHTTVRCAGVELPDPKDSRAAGEQLAAALAGERWKHLFILSEGVKVNGSELVKGLVGRAGPEVAVTGGLSGDGERLARTIVWLEAPGEPQAPRERQVVGVGFYGDRLQVGYGSMGGWDPFGPERLVTRSSGNVLYELDGHSALQLYEKYLGEHAAGLPASGLLFPLALRSEEEKAGVVRTILAIDRAQGSMTFAGDIPEGAHVRLMKANFERLIDGATGAAKTSYEAIGSRTPELAILISCVGRKLVLRQRIEEEVESVQEILGEGAALTGFYSYGEISPFTPSARCELHNQTMTITTLSER